MTKYPIAAACASILIAVTAGLAVPGDAHAAVYRGIFDPSDANYEWKGTHQFDVSDACLSFDGWRQANTGYGGSSYDQDGYAIEGTDVVDPCAVSLTAGSFSLRRLTGPDTTFKTLDFDQMSGDEEPYSLLPSFDIWGVYVKDGELFGVDSFLIGGFRFAEEEEAALGFGEIDQYGGFYIRWESGWAPTDFIPSQEDLFPGTFTAGSNQTYNQSFVDPAYAYVNDCGIGECDTREITPGVSAPNLTFSRVPEPGTVSLVLAAIAGAAFARRRRRS